MSLTDSEIVLIDQVTWVEEVVEKVTAVSGAVQAELEEAPWEEAC